MSADKKTDLTTETTQPFADETLENVAGGASNPMQTFRDTALRNYHAVQQNAQKVAEAQKQFTAVQNFLKGK